MTGKGGSPRLGRGLASLLGEAASLLTSTDTVGGPAYLGIDLLDSGPFQPRGTIDPAVLSELTESIRARGILQPLLVRRHPTEPGRYQIIAGERRWRAARAAGLHDVPALVRDLEDREALAAALVENLQRQDLNPIEEAEGYRRLMGEFAMTQEALGTAVGKSRSHVANTLRLLNLPELIQNELKQGRLSAGHARALLGHPQPEKAALDVIARGLNVRQTEALVSPSSRLVASDRPSRQKDPETASLEHDIAERLGLKVEIAFNGKGGTVKIHYSSLDQLDGLVALLSRES